MCTGLQELENYIIVLYFRLFYWSGQHRNSPKQIHLDKPFSCSAKHFLTRKVKVVPSKVTPRSQPLWWVVV